MARVILEEINVKAIEFATDDSGVVNKGAKANFKSIGPKFGKIVQKVAGRIKDMTANEISEFEDADSISFDIEGQTVTLTGEDIDITTQDIKGWVVESDDVVSVALDTELTDELRAEGIAREFINRVQNMRKEAGFQVTDRIRIYYKSDDILLQQSLKNFRDYIKTETLAAELTNVGSNGENLQLQSINGIDCSIMVETVKE
jgi:isoleucyl-tRNA synthetase